MSGYCPERMICAANRKRSTEVSRLIFHQYEGLPAIPNSRAERKLHFHLTIRSNLRLKWIVIKPSMLILRLFAAIRLRRRPVFNNRFVIIDVHERI
jgi:hypothetical protein